MHIEYIRTFLDLIETRNFHRTAHRLEVNQSTVSFRVRALEEALGARLFVRGRGGAQLTAEGQQFERYALNLRLAWNLARQEVGMPEGFSSRLRIGMQTQLTNRLVTAWGIALRQQLPGTAIHVASDYSKAMTEQLVFGNLDLGLLYDPENRPELEVEHGFNETFRMVATSPRALADVTPAEYILITESPYFQARHAELLPGLQQPALSVEVGAMALSCLRAIEGAAYLPSRLADGLIMAGEMFPVADAPAMNQPVHIAYHARNRHRPDVLTAIETLRTIDINRPREADRTAVP